MSKVTANGYPPPLAAFGTVAALALAFTFSNIDRLIPNLLIEHIKADLNLSDVEVSLLTGLAFALFYSTTAVPIARIADLWSRKKVILIGVAFWSMMTVVSGFSRSFWQLFAARMGVGVGEAALTPSALAMVADLFPPERQARGMAVFMIGASLGAGIALIVGGFAIRWAESAGPLIIPGIGTLAIWQTVLIGCGLATFLTLIPLAFITDPARKRTAAAPRGHSIRDVGSELWRHRAAYGCIFLSTPLLSLAGYGANAWIPAMFIREFGWKAGDIGVTLGAVILVTGGLSLFAGAMLSDFLRGRGNASASLVVLGFTGALTALAGLTFLVANTSAMGFAAVIAFTAALSPMSAVGPVALQAVAPPAMRAQISSIFLLVVNLIGIGAGPTVVALLTDNLFHDEKRVGDAIGLVVFFACALSTIPLVFLLKAYRRLLAQRQEEGGEHAHLRPDSAR